MSAAPALLRWTTWATPGVSARARSTSINGGSSRGYVRRQVVAGAAWPGRGTDREAVGPEGMPLGISSGARTPPGGDQRPHGGVRICVRDYWLVVERAEREQDQHDGADVEQEPDPRQDERADHDARDGAGKEPEDPAPRRPRLVVAGGVVGGVDEHHGEHGGASPEPIRVAPAAGGDVSSRGTELHYVLYVLSRVEPTPALRNRR